MLLEDVFVSQSVLVSATRYINHILRQRTRHQFLNTCYRLPLMLHGLREKKHFLMEKLQLWLKIARDMWDVTFHNFFSLQIEALSLLPGWLLTGCVLFSLLYLWLMRVLTSDNDGHFVTILYFHQLEQEFYNVTTTERKRGGWTVDSVLMIRSSASW